MLVSDFHFHLPEELIAQAPLADRAGARLLHLNSAAGILRDRSFREFPEILRAGDLAVFNNTKVFPARLYGRRSGRVAEKTAEKAAGKAAGKTAGKIAVKVAPSTRNQSPSSERALPGKVEVLLTRQISQQPNEWDCLVRPGKKIRLGEQLLFGEQDELQAEVIGRGDFGERRIRFERTCEFFALLEKIGHVPLPPYIARADSAGDRDRYQTVYAREPGSVAAPTAGLHFTPGILERLREREIETCEVTLHVGLGTFQPVRVERVEEHRLHSEAYSISNDAAEKIRRARLDGRRIVAVGTTTVRTLEFAALQNGGEIRPGAGEANIFIYPGYKFQVVHSLLTNFHLPESTLLMLVSALGGKENVMRAYAHAVEQKYRFYSYGDCMFVE